MPKPPITCLITGANRGIGLELARAYARIGATVIATARDPAAASDLTRLKAEHASLQILPLDVTDATSFDALAARLSRHPIDVVIANAGLMGPRGSLDDPDNTAARWAEVLAVNVTGVYLTARALVPNLKAAAGAKFAILSSRMGSSVSAAGSSYLYRASKAAAANLGANLAVEWKPHGIAVGSYHPGWVQTDMGGAAADIPATTSATGLIDRIAHLSLATSGTFEDYAGQRIAH
jgi:NAD(P)-dependent dehydrogenase (short-subunit alcohol dehydrogenase family)